MSFIPPNSRLQLSDTTGNINNKGVVGSNTKAPYLSTFPTTNTGTSQGTYLHLGVDGQSNLRTDLLNASGTSSGGFNFWTSNSTQAPQELAQITTDGVAVQRNQGVNQLLICPFVVGSNTTTIIFTQNIASLLPIDTPVQIIPYAGDPANSQPPSNPAFLQYNTTYYVIYSPSNLIFLSTTLGGDPDIDVSGLAGFCIAKVITLGQQNQAFLNSNSLTLMNGEAQSVLTPTSLTLNNGQQILPYNTQGTSTGSFVFTNGTTFDTITSIGGNPPLTIDADGLQVHTALNMNNDYITNLQSIQNNSPNNVLDIYTNWNQDAGTWDAEIFMNGQGILIDLNSQDQSWNFDTAGTITQQSSVGSITNWTLSPTTLSFTDGTNTGNYAKTSSSLTDGTNTINTQPNQILVSNTNQSHTQIQSGNINLTDGFYYNSIASYTGFQAIQGDPVLGALGVMRVNTHNISLADGDGGDIRSLSLIKPPTFQGGNGLEIYNYSTGGKIVGNAQNNTAFISCSTLDETAYGKLDKVSVVFNDGTYTRTDLNSATPSLTLYDGTNTAVYTTTGITYNGTSPFGGGGTTTTQVVLGTTGFDFYGTPGTHYNVAIKSGVAYFTPFEFFNPVNITGSSGQYIIGTLPSNIIPTSDLYLPCVNTIMYSSASSIPPPNLFYPTAQVALFIDLAGNLTIDLMAQSLGDYNYSGLYTLQLPSFSYVIS